MLDLDATDDPLHGHQEGRFFTATAHRLSQNSVWAKNSRCWQPACSRSCGALLPFALEAASDQAVVGIDGTVAALGAARFVACPLDAEAPLPERGLAIGLEPARGGDSGGELCRLEGGEEGPRDDLVNLDAADVEAIDAAARS